MSRVENGEYADAVFVLGDEALNALDAAAEGKDFIVHSSRVALNSEDGAQYAKDFAVDGINVISEKLSGSVDCLVKIRFRAPAAQAHIEFESPNTARVTFSEPQRSVTPGQFAAFYIGDEVIGGARIAGVETQGLL